MMFVLFIAGLNRAVKAQNTKDSSQASGTAYIESYLDYFLFKSNINNRSLNFNLSPRINGLTQYTKRLWYRPSVRSSLGFGVSFKDLALSYSFQIREDPLLNRQGADSEYTDFQLHSLGRKIGYDFYYQDFKGYFLSNLDISNVNNFLSSVQSVFNGKPLIRRDDLRVQNYLANVFYVFNPKKFSYRSSFVLDERQLRSAGSWMITGSLGYTKASADSSFIPPNDSLGFNPEAYFKRTDFYTLAITPGYAYNLVFKNGIFGTLSVSGLIGMQYSEGRGDALFDTGLNYFAKGIARAAIGIHKKRWAIGASVATDIQAMNTRFVEYRTNVLDISIFAAYRIRSNFRKGKTSVIDLPTWLKFGRKRKKK